MPLVIFGFGAGLGMPAPTDTVMAAVPEADAGVGSAVNDVSRELGGALGIATIGSVVSGFYRSNVGEALAGVLPPDLVDLAGESVGVAAVTAQSLPVDVAATLTDASHAAFVDAMTAGFVLSAVILVAAVVVALTLIPRHMRQTQAEGEVEAPVNREISPEPQPKPAVA